MARGQCLIDSVRWPSRAVAAHSTTFEGHRTIGTSRRTQRATRGERSNRNFFMSDDELLRKKRISVGLIALACLAGAIVLIWFPEREGLRSALVRVGTLMAAFWLVLPSKGRPAAWTKLSSNWMIASGVVAAIAMPRARAMFPVIAIIIGIALFARPRKR